MKLTKSTALRLDPKTKKMLKDIADYRGTQVSSIIRLALLEFLRRETNENNS